MALQTSEPCLGGGLFIITIQRTVASLQLSCAITDTWPHSSLFSFIQLCCLLESYVLSLPLFLMLCPQTSCVKATLIALGIGLSRVAMVTGRAVTAPQALPTFLTLAKSWSLSLSFPLSCSLYFLPPFYFPTSLYSPLNYFPLCRAARWKWGGCVPQDKCSADVEKESLTNKHSMGTHMHTVQYTPHTHTPLNQPPSTFTQTLLWMVPC